MSSLPLALSGGAPAHILRATVCTVAVGLAGCGGQGTASSSTGGSPAGELAPAKTLHSEREVPATVEQFLEDLLPAGRSTVRVVVGLRFAGGQEGTLEIVQKPGGYRRETWTMGLQADAEVVGQTTWTPDAMWTRDGDGGWTKRTLAHKRLAERFVALPAERRAAITSAIHQHQDDLVRARSDASVERRTVLDRSCVQLRVAAENLCVWEETGIPLALEGAAAQGEARSIEVDLELGADTFAGAPAGSDVRSVAGQVAVTDVEIDGWLEALARGETVPHAAILQPAWQDPEATLPSTAIDAPGP